MRFQLIYDPEQWDFIQEKLLPLVEGIIDDHAAYSLDELKTLKGETALLVYLSDGDLHEALPIVLENRLKLAVLPHPEAKEACIGLGVNRQLEKAVDHLKKLEEPVLTDVLYCNDQVVFNQR